LLDFIALVSFAKKIFNIKEGAQVSMSKNAELEETLTLVEKLCTTDQIKNLLRERKGDKDVRLTAESKEDLVQRNLRAAIGAKSIELDKVFDLIRLAEENGNQHIFYYSPRSKKIADALSFESVGRQLWGPNWEKQVEQFPTLRLKPNDYQYSDFRVLTKKPKDWILKVYGQALITSATGKMEKRGNSVWREFVEEPLRIILLVRWNSPDLREIRVQRNESRRRIDDWLRQIWVMLQPALSQSNVDAWGIERAIARIILEHKINEKLYTFRDASIEDKGVHASFQAYSDQGDLFASQRSIDAIESYIKAKADCRGLTVTWFANPNAVPQEEIKTLLGVKMANEVIFSSHCLPGDLDYVTEQLRRFSKTTS
jgi:hypothetical protein